MSDSYESFNAGDSIQDLLAAVEQKRLGGVGVSASGASQKPDSKPGVSAKPKPKPAGKKKPAAKRGAAAGKGKSKGKATPPTSGLVTLSVRGCYASVCGLGLWGGAALAMMVACAVLLSLSWQRSLLQWQPQDLVLEDVEGKPVPGRLIERFIRDYPRATNLLHPDAAVLADFRDFLLARPAVKRVDAVAVGYRPGDAAAPVQVLEAVVELRKPVLPVQLADGSHATVAKDGIVLPPCIEAAPGLPLVRGYHDGGNEALRELLAFWPELSYEVPPTSIAEVHLHADLQRRGQRGIVLQMYNGTRILWGRPGDGRYGVSNQDKIARIVHALQCQGGADDAVIDVRYDQAVYSAAL